jgi:hypothetical protein
MSEKKKKQDYISVGELSVGFSENTLPPTDAFIGKQIELHYESGKKEKVTFIDIETLKWETEDQGRRERFICSYNATLPRSDICFVDFIVSYGDCKSVSIILDMGKSIATIVTGILPKADEIMIPLIVRAEKKIPLTSVQVLFEHAAVGGPFTRDTPRHEKTLDLVGERIQWTYSSRDAYEHVYLNETTYTWHCISGNEKGLADTDRCFYYKVDDKFYLFVWIEKIIPTVGVVLEDLDVMRSYGKIFGYENYTTGGRISNFPVGSFGTLLNKTEYDRNRIEKQTDHKQNPLNYED